VNVDVDAVVIGAGIVGLASAAALAAAGRSVFVFERNHAIARETSARNSEVIHAGIYYPPGSLKAELCVAGRIALYERCRRLRIPHRACGKWIVATDADEVATLETLRTRAQANGVFDLALRDAGAVRRREPAVRAVAALHSPSSGIVDTAALCLSFAAESEQHGAVLLKGSEIGDIERRGGAWTIEVRGPDGESQPARARAVVNAAGLASDAVAARAGFDVDALGYRIHPCKGDYFSLAPAAGVHLDSLVYPTPAGPGLGIHATIDLAGRIRLGPDAEYVAGIRYDVDATKADRFAEAVRRFLPAVDAGHLQPEMAGIRPRLAAPGESFRDFVVREESDRGAPGFVNLIGIESPGLTAAPAIADRVVSLLSSF